MANHLGKILDFLEIPQVKLAEYLGITPQAVSSLIQSENTKKYNDKIAKFIGIDEELLSFYLVKDEIRTSHLLNLKIAYILKDYEGDARNNYMFNPKIVRLQDQMYNESIIEDVRDVFKEDDEIDKRLIELVLYSITHKKTKYGVIEYEIIKNFLFLLNAVSSTDATFKLETYQSILSFTRNIKFPETNVKEYLENLITNKNENLDEE